MAVEVLRCESDDKLCLFTDIRHSYSPVPAKLRHSSGAARLWLECLGHQNPIPSTMGLLRPLLHASASCTSRSRAETSWHRSAHWGSPILSGTTKKWDSMTKVAWRRQFCQGGLHSLLKSLPAVSKALLYGPTQADQPQQATQDHVRGTMVQAILVCAGGGAAQQPSEVRTGRAPARRRSRPGPLGAFPQAAGYMRISWEGVC